jgi:hypothetical protein
LYLHGLAHSDIELALRGLLGEGAPLSAASLSRLKANGTGTMRRGSTSGWRTSKSCTSGRMGRT